MESSTQPVALGVPVTQDTRFGAAFIKLTIDEFNALGFAYGDCVSISFSNGYSLDEVPYFNGYYTAASQPVLVAYPGYPYIDLDISTDGGMWHAAGLSEGDTADIRLVERGRHLTVQQTFDTAYTNDRKDYATDEIFANYRSCAGGQLGQGVVFRGASPIDDEYNRAAYVSRFIQRDGISFVLDISDTPETMAAFIDECHSSGLDCSYFEELLAQGRVCALGLSAGYRGMDFRRKLVDGLRQMIGFEPPYYIHCVEGKDRTGFVAILLEALMGASYAQMCDDYMQTYENYYGISPTSQPDKYDALVSLRFDDMLAFLAGLLRTDGHKPGKAELVDMDFRDCARAYLASGGMDDADIDALVNRLTTD